MSKNKKKLGYSQYENLLAEAYQKLDLLAYKMNELQSWFLGYIEYSGNALEFNNWMETRIKEHQEKTDEKEKVNEKV